MKQMVCNCNSYGNIDYKQPILLKSNDYRTSYDYGIKHIPLIIPSFYNDKSPPTKDGSCFIDVQHDAQNTVYNKDFHKKYINYEVKFPRATLLHQVNYMRIVKEKTFKKPPPPRSFPIPTYKAEYCLKPPILVHDKIPDIHETTSCRVVSIGLGEQPRIKIEECGVMKHLDPFVSTSHMQHVPFSQDAAHSAKCQPLTLYNAKYEPRLKQIKVRKPINDELIFKRPIQDRFVRYPVYPVPNSGSTSEYSSKYLSPTKGCMYVKSLSSDVTYEDSLSNPSKRQTLAAPYMYCTEYCHIGTGRNVKTSVNTNIEKKGIKHDGCE